MAGAVRIDRRRDPAVALSVLHAYRRHSARRLEFARGLLGLRPELLFPHAYRRNRTSAAVASSRRVISWRIRRGERLPEPASHCDYRDMEPFALARADGAGVARDFGGDFHLRTWTEAPYRRRHFVRDAMENLHARSASQERAPGTIHDVRVPGRRGYRVALAERGRVRSMAEMGARCAGRRAFNSEHFRWLLEPAGRHPRFFQHRCLPQLSRQG